MEGKRERKREIKKNENRDGQIVIKEGVSKKGKKKLEIKKQKI